MAMIILPPELFYQVALHLPSTGDVLTFSLIHSRVREILSTPVLFKERLALQGWDVSAWLEEDNNATVSLSPQGYLERWMRIDHIYCRTVQLFDDAAADDYFLKSPPNVDSDRDATEPEPEQPDRGLSNDIVTPKSPDQSPDPCNPGIDRQKRIIWMGKLSVVLPEFVAHHRAFPGPSSFLSSSVQKKITCVLAFQVEKISREFPKLDIVVLFRPMRAF
jgi:hypothetical protein